MRRKKRNKKTCQAIHATKRGVERAGIVLGPKSQAEIVRMIQGVIPGAKFLEKQSNRVSLFDVEWEGHRLVTAYDRHRKQIITILTHEMYEQGMRIMNSEEEE